ncbi:hypothetical protein DB88DRAFT_470860 [Papiliotrema laurentii]|uniref:Uncharacterized protein n=1 Tax=Papiliotrema laurentii TaxID=5418 RepID=A0AAD9L891_PAPLA|nr:hypothetical protein DB88DRAFT_470860 [Papiliotrema laurentii]
MTRPNLVVYISLTPTATAAQSPNEPTPSLSEIDAPPPYTVSPHSADPRHLSRALRDFRDNNDPAQWGLRRLGRQPLQHSWWLRWLLWLGESAAPPDPPSWAASVSNNTPWLSMGNHGVI